jgi:hypothetical protein
MRAPQTRARAALACARVWVRVWAHPQPCETFPSAWTACGFGAQALRDTRAFNANIGAWNTASVSNMYQVGAASGPAVHHRKCLGRARPGLRCGAARCARRPRRCARVRTRGGPCLRGALG